MRCLTSDYYSCGPTCRCELSGVHTKRIIASTALALMYARNVNACLLVLCTAPIRTLIIVNNCDKDLANDMPVSSRTLAALIIISAPDKSTNRVKLHVAINCFNINQRSWSVMAQWRPQRADNRP